MRVINSGRTAIAAPGQLSLLLVTPATGYPRVVPALLSVG
jgi:hypothetical protein